MSENWLQEYILLAFRIDVDPLVLLRLRQASQMLEGVWHNAAILLDEGQSDQSEGEAF